MRRSGNVISHSESSRQCTVSLTVEYTQETQLCEINTERSNVIAPSDNVKSVSHQQTTVNTTVCVITCYDITNILKFMYMSTTYVSAKTAKIPCISSNRKECCFTNLHQ